MIYKLKIKKDFMVLVNKEGASHCAPTQKTTFLSEDTKEKLIKAGKISTVALTTLALFAVACFAGVVAIPAIAGGSVTLGSLALCAGAGVGVAAIIVPFSAQGEETSMYRYTRENLKDSVKFLLNSVGIAAGAAAIGVLAPVVIVPLVAVGGFFFFFLTNGAGH